MLQQTKSSFSIIVIIYVQSKKIDEARPVYERLVNQFPTSGRYWKLYIEQEVSVFVDFVFRVLVSDTG